MQPAERNRETDHGYSTDAADQGGVVAAAAVFHNDAHGSFDPLEIVCSQVVDHQDVAGFVRRRVGHATRNRSPPPDEDVTFERRWFLLHRSFSTLWAKSAGNPLPS